MDELLKAILSGVGAPAEPQQAGGADPLLDMLGTILGGASAPASSGDVFGDILGAVLGGGEMGRAGRAGRLRFSAGRGP